VNSFFNITFNSFPFFFLHLIFSKTFDIEMEKLLKIFFPISFLVFWQNHIFNNQNKKQ